MSPAPSRLLVATRNRGKQAEFRTLLEIPGVELVFPDDIALEESEAEAHLEVYDTFEANARAKALWFSAISGLPAVADDSGLEVDALGGKPGVHSRRFAGVSGTAAEEAAANIALLLQRLDGVAPAQRTARFRCVLVLVRPHAAEVIADGVVEGAIAAAPSGSGGFGYDPVFISHELGVSFGAASAEEKRRVSHRARAAGKLRRSLVPE